MKPFIKYNSNVIFPSMRKNFNKSLLEICSDKKIHMKGAMIKNKKYLREVYLSISIITSFEI